MNQSERDLLDLDRKFCLESQKDKEKAWEKYFSDDIIFGGDHQKHYIDDKDTILSSLKDLYNLTDIKFTWEPVHVFISDDQSLGITTGTYYRSYEINGKFHERKGVYTTTWRKINSSWKIIFDMGN